MGFHSTLRKTEKKRVEEKLEKGNHTHTHTHTSNIGAYLSNLKGKES